MALALMVGPFLMLWLTNSAMIAALALFVEMLAALLWNVVTVSYRQRVIPGDLLGRVNAIYRFFGWGMMPIGALIGGVLVEYLTPGWGRDTALRAPMLMAAIGLGGMWIYAALFLRFGRNGT